MSNADGSAGSSREEGTTEHEQRESVAEEVAEGATPGTIGALDGAAAAGSAGATRPPAADFDSGGGDGGVPTEAPDPSIGPD